jgi:hypothetical protein
MSKYYDFCPLLIHPFTCYLTGPTGAGKTLFVLRIIKECKRFIVPAPERIIICYGQYQAAYENLHDVEFIAGLPPPDLLNVKTRNLLILDDLMHKCDASVAELFTQGSHHTNASVIFLSQNLFCKNKATRDISLNCHYLVLFKNPRDASQIRCLGRQIYPTRGNHFNEAYAEATKHPHSYLLIDLKQATPDDLRLRTDIFPDEKGFVYVYK